MVAKKLIRLLISLLSASLIMSCASREYNDEDGAETEFFGPRNPSYLFVFKFERKGDDCPVVREQEGHTACECRAQVSRRSPAAEVRKTAMAYHDRKRGRFDMNCFATKPSGKESQGPTRYKKELQADYFTVMKSVYPYEYVCTGILNKDVPYEHSTQAHGEQVDCPEQ
jgi:hypothetical protein